MTKKKSRITNMRVMLLALTTKGKGLQFSRVTRELGPGKTPDRLTLDEYIAAIKAGHLNMVDLLMERLERRDQDERRDPNERRDQAPPLHRVMNALVSRLQVLRERARLHGYMERLMVQYGAEIRSSAWSTILSLKDMDLIRWVYRQQGTRWLSSSHLDAALHQNLKTGGEQVVRFLMDECGLIPPAALSEHCVADVNFFRYMYEEQRVELRGRNLAMAITQCDLELVQFLTEEVGLDASTFHPDFLAYWRFWDEPHVDTVSVEKVERLMRILIEKKLGSAMEHYKLIMMIGAHDLMTTVLSDVKIPYYGTHKLLTLDRADHRLVHVLVRQGHPFTWDQLKRDIRGSNYSVTKAYVQVLKDQAQDQDQETFQKEVIKAMDYFAQDCCKYWREDHCEWGLTCLKAIFEVTGVPFARRHKNRMMESRGNGAQLLHSLGAIEPKKMKLPRNLHVKHNTWHYLIDHGAKVQKLEAGDQMFRSWVYCDEQCAGNMVPAMRMFADKGTKFGQQWFTHELERSGGCNVTREFIDFALEQGWTPVITDRMGSAFFRHAPEEVIAYLFEVGRLQSLPGFIMVQLVASGRQRFLTLYHAYADGDDDNHRRQFWPVEQEHVREAVSMPEVLDILVLHGGGMVAAWIDASFADHALDTRNLDMVKHLYNKYGVAPSKLGLGSKTPYDDAAFFTFLQSITGIRPQVQDLVECLQRSKSKAGLACAVLQTNPEMPCTYDLYIAAASQTDACLVKFLHEHRIPLHDLDQTTINQMFGMAPHPHFSAAVWEYMTSLEQKPCPMDLYCRSLSGRLPESDALDKLRFCVKAGWAIPQDAIDKVMRYVGADHLQLQEEMLKAGFFPSDKAARDVMWDISSSVPDLIRLLIRYMPDFPLPTNDLALVRQCATTSRFDVLEILFQHFGGRLPVTDLMLYKAVDYGNLRVLRLFAHVRRLDDDRWLRRLTKEQRKYVGY